MTLANVGRVKTRVSAPCPPHFRTRNIDAWARRCVAPRALLLLGGGGVDVAQWPALVTYLARMQERPQVSEANRD